MWNFVYKPCNSKACASILFLKAVKKNKGKKMKLPHVKKKLPGLLSGAHIQTLRGFSKKNLRGRGSLKD